MHRPLGARAGGVLLLGLLAAGCGELPPVGEGCEALPGELVISEFMAAPLESEAGTEWEDEWIELYNPSGRPVTLNRLYVSAAGSTEPKSISLRNAGTLAAGDYYVVGAPPSDIEHIDYSYTEWEIDRASLRLTNSTGLLRLSCKGETIDEVAYGERGNVPAPVAGRSQSFDGGAAPDALLNDDKGWWCAAGDAYDGRQVGTPGTRNVNCGFATCVDNGTERDVEAPEPGDVLISEVFADPVGADGSREWLELYINRESPVDLNRVEVRVVTSRTDSVELEQNACLRFAGDSYVVLGASTDTAANGDTPVDIAVPEMDGGFFVNGAHTIEIWRGSTLLDRAQVPEAYSNTRAGVDYAYSNMLDGAAFDPAVLSPEANDTQWSFCRARRGRDTGFFEMLGTPGAPNPVCGVVACEQAGGGLRAVVPPAADALIVNEVLADADSVADGDGEWIELYAEVGGVDLNGLRIRNRKENDDTFRETRIAATECLTLGAGDYAVAANSDDPAVNGGLPPAVPVLDTLRFFNYPGDLDGQMPFNLVVEVRSGDAVVDSATVPVSSDAGVASGLVPQQQSVSANDSPENFCFAESGGLYDDLGSPGQPNVCGPTCLDGEAPRPLRTPQPGELIITEVMYDLPDADNCEEWFEVYATRPLDLNGVELINDSIEEPLGQVGDACLPVSAGYSVIASANATFASTTPVAARTSACLQNGPDTLVLRSAAGQIDATAEYGSGGNGQTFSLISSDPAAVDNSDRNAWCENAEPTPAQVNTCN